jgi:hypothetical protein
MVSVKKSSLIRYNKLEIEMEKKGRKRHTPESRTTHSFPLYTSICRWSCCRVLRQGGINVLYSTNAKILKIL